MNIAKLLQQPLIIYPFLLEQYTTATALVMSQVIYWSNWSYKENPDAMYWFYKDMESWKADTGLSEYQIRAARTALKADGLLEEMLFGSPVKLHFRIGKQLRKDLK